MLKKLSIAVLGLALAIAFPRPGLAETVMEKVARTGTLTVGSRLEIVPYSYVDDKKQLVGYSIDILNQIKAELSKQLGKPIEIQIIPQGATDDRIGKVSNRQLDIACDSQFTWQRDQFVDFSIPYSISGIRLLVKQGSGLGTPESLIGKRIGVIENSIGEQVIKKVQPKATVVTFKSVEAAVAASKAGQLDATAGDSIILAGLSQKLNLTGYQLSPNEPYARYGLSCAVPQDNSKFLHLVNYSIAKLMQGYLIGDEQYVAQISRWFGPQGIIDDLDPQIVRAFFDFMIITHEQIPLSQPLAGEVGNRK